MLLTIMEPVKGMIVEPVMLGGIRVEKGTPIWITAEEPESYQIEYNQRFYPMPKKLAVKCPVPRPAIDELKKLDSCFGDSEDAFEEVIKDMTSYYRFLRCKAHGNFFLEDTRGGIGMYSRLIYIGQIDHHSFEGIWSKYHYVPDDLLNYMGIAL